MNFRRLCRKWEKWRLSKSDHKWLDLTECQFIGEGSHEILFFTFGRHLRLAQLRKCDEFTFWVGVGPHWSDCWHDANGFPYEEVPLVGITRGISEPASFVEPLRVLAVASCANGQFAFDEIARKVPSLTRQTVSPVIGNPRFCRFRGVLQPLLDSAVKAVALPAPTIEPIEHDASGAMFSVSLEQMIAVAQATEDFVETPVPCIGTGSHVLYAYTYSAIEDAAVLSSQANYPVKIGWTQFEEDCGSVLQAAVARVRSQVPFPEPVRLLGALACDNGRNTEKYLHGKLKASRLKCIGTEWFATNRDEVGLLMKNCL